MTSRATLFAGAAGLAVIAAVVVVVMKSGQARTDAQGAPDSRTSSTSPASATNPATMPSPASVLAAMLEAPPAPPPRPSALPVRRPTSSPSPSATTMPAITSGDAAMAFEQITRWHQQGRHDDALMNLSRLRDAAPDQFKILRWRVAAPGDKKRVLVGQTRTFLVLERPLGPDRRPAVQCSPKPSGIMYHLHCGDPVRGQSVWTRKVAGLETVFVDPAGDDLYLLGEGEGAKLVRIRGSDGESDLEREVGTGGPVRGIANKGQHEILDPGSLVRPGSPATVRVFDVPSGNFKNVSRAEAAGLAKTLDLEALNVRTPDESARVINARYGGASEPTWTYRHPGPSLNPPLVRDGDVYLLEGAYETPSEVVRLEGATGKVKWKFPMPRGAGRGLDLTNGYVTAVGGNDTAYVLNANTGTLVASIGLPGLLMPEIPAPLVVGRYVIAADRSGIACYSLDAAAHNMAAQKGLAIGDPQVSLLEARCLAALEREDDALAGLESALERSPEFVDGWALSATLAAKRGYAADAVGALVRIMDLTGSTEAPAMREHFGLIKRLPTAGMIARPAIIGGRLYFGARDGTCTVLDPSTLEVVDSRRLDAGIYAMNREGNKLTAVCGDVTERTLFEFPQKIDQGAEKEENEPETQKLPNANKIPLSWFRRDKRDGLSVPYRGKFYRPLGGGQVRVLDPNQMDRVQTYDSQVPGIEAWNIAILPSGPIGYNQSGLFELNEFLAPVRQTTAFGPKGEHHGIGKLITNGRTMGLVRWSGEEEPKSQDGRVYLLEVRTPDGQELLRSQRVAIAEAAVAGRFLPLAGGYLLVSQELTWVPETQTAKVWQFEIDEPRSYGRVRIPGRRKPRSRYDGFPPHTPDFTPPLIANNRLFVGHVRGGIYVFDLSRVTSGTASPSPAPATPPVALLPLPAGPSQARSATPSGVSPTGVSPTTPGPAEARSLVALPHKLEDVAVGGAGRYLVLQYKTAKQAAIFDAVQRKNVGIFDTPSDDFLCAAGLTKLVLVDRGANTVQRFDLATGRREQEAQLPDAGAKYEAAVMGEASEGPLLLVTEQFPTGPVYRRNVLLDPRTLRELPWSAARRTAASADAAARPSRDRRPMRGEPIDPDNLWANRPLSLTASPDGTVFAGPTNANFGTGGADAYGAVFFDGTQLQARVLDERDAVPRPGVLRALDGRLRVALKEADAGPEATGATAFPSAFQQLLLCYHPGEHSTASDFGPRYTLWSVADRKRLLDLPKFDELHRLEGFSVSRSPTDPNPRPDPLDGSKRMRLVPQANLIVSIPPSNDRLYLRPFDLAGALNSAKTDYLFVDSPPPAAAVKGQAYSHRLTAKSKAGGVEFALGANAPQGLTVTPAGEVKWAVPAAFPNYLATFTVSVKDKSGKTAEHACTIPVQ